mmetsp:Transcript_15826/g.36639  ORF Transcript_15826/g.36639 Transcript_15826/m.36639 type:complete len:147 (-) Transcript_15826:325-765(-)
MVYTLLKVSLFARCRTQLRHLSSFTSLSRTGTAADRSKYDLTPVAKNRNGIYTARPPPSRYQMCCDPSLPQSISDLRIAQPSVNYQLSTLYQPNCHQLSKCSSNLDTVIQAMNRNARKPKKANKGSRPCSRAGRRKRKEKVGKRGR